MSGIRPQHLLKFAIRPALASMGPDYATRSAEQLLLGTAAKESLLFELEQRPAGPALGLWQMEPGTFNDLLLRCPMSLRKAIFELACISDPKPEAVAWNLRFGAAMCRLKYLDARPKLPPEGDVPAMAAYWKTYYNSRKGKGVAIEFEEAWADLIAPQFAELWP